MNTTNAFITAQALDALAVAEGERVLEVGPDNGHLSRSTVARPGDAGRHLGFEYNPDIAALAAETFACGNTRVEVRAGDFMAQTPEAEEFDALVAVNVISFFEDLGACLSRSREWLRPGGRIVIGQRSLPAMSAPPFIEHGFTFAHSTSCCARSTPLVSSRCRRDSSTRA